MSPFRPTEQDLLKTVLEPLLADFEYWFTKSRSLLESEDMPFLSESEQAHLLQRVENAQQEVQASKMLFQATDGKVGIDPNAMFPWHSLLTECWQVARKWRLSHL